MARRRVALVVHRCGEDVIGGAERFCLELAKRLYEHVDVEILTTCASDHRTWKNVYPAGPTTIGAVPAIRFPVARERRTSAFDRASRALRYTIHPSAKRLDGWMREQGPDVPQLTAALRARNDDAVLFLPYLYASTYFGLPDVARRSILIPLAHDEWMIHLPMWDPFFALPSAIVTTSHGERAVLRSRFPDLALDEPPVGFGIEPPANIDEGAFAARHGIDEPYLLYVGRIDPAKNIDALLASFLAGADRTQTLVLAGPQTMPLPDHPKIRVVGTLDERAKFEALAGARMLVHPSLFESLSIVLLEAWSVGTPVLVNAQSEVLVDQCRRARGGAWYRSDVDFTLLAESDFLGEGTALGGQGREYVRAEHSWRDVTAAYLAVIERVAAAVS